MEQIHEIERILKEWRDGTPDGENRCYFVIMAEKTADGSKYYNDTASGGGLLLADAMENAMKECRPLQLAISTAVYRFKKEIR